MIAEGRVWIGRFSILFDEREGKYVAICRNCGCELSQLDVKAIETGFYYCSITCAKEDIAVCHLLYINKKYSYNMFII